MADPDRDVDAIGILSEVLFGLPPVLVLIGGVSITAAMVWFGVTLLRLRTVSQGV